MASTVTQNQLLLNMLPSGMKEQAHIEAVRAIDTMGGLKLGCHNCIMVGKLGGRKAQALQRFIAKIDANLHHSTSVDRLLACAMVASILASTDGHDSRICLLNGSRQETESRGA